MLVFSLNRPLTKHRVLPQGYSSGLQNASCSPGFLLPLLSQLHRDNFFLLFTICSLYFLIATQAEVNISDNTPLESTQSLMVIRPNFGTEMGKDKGKTASSIHNVSSLHLRMLLPLGILYSHLKTPILKTNNKM